MENVIYNHHQHTLAVHESWLCTSKTYQSALQLLVKTQILTVQSRNKAWSGEWGVFCRRHYLMAGCKGYKETKNLTGPEMTAIKILS